MQELRGTVMRYPWGTRDAIPALLGIPADGRPVAEYWLGAHATSPSMLGDQPLTEALAQRPSLLGKVAADSYGDRLPFLMKVLSARHALSIQAHPSREQAAEGFARENAARIPVEDETRTYKDDWPKPELLVALSEFSTLIGFREPRATVRLFEELGVWQHVEHVFGPLLFRDGTAATQEVFLDVLSLEGDRLQVVNHILAAAVEHSRDDGELGSFARTATELDEAFPSDSGILAALLMNRVTLRPGQAVYVPTGVLHAHLRGTGVEVMANSDNVLRGGLTSKHIAVDDLVDVVHFDAGQPCVLDAVEVSPGVRSYPTTCAEFHLWRLEVRPGHRLQLPAHGSARIALLTKGHASLDDGTERLDLAQGQAAFLAADDARITAIGDAEVFLTAPDRP